MELHPDFTQRVVVHSATLPWTPSPMQGVQRRMLDRIGGEVARATSIVRYAAGSKFSPHTHHGGEEFVVLDGVFEDEHGEFPTGSYVRNPPTSAHTPGSSGGCTIFVKLWQFDPTDREQIRIETSSRRFTATARAEVESMPLFQDTVESVRLERWRPGAQVDIELRAGGEFLVLAGSFMERQDELRAQSWLRMQPSSTLHATAGSDGATVWVKTGHLIDRIGPPPA